MRTKKIQPEGGPSLWDGLSTDADPQAPQEQPENDTLKALNEVRELAEKSGYYVALPNDAILTRAENYFNAYYSTVRDALINTGTTEETADVVVKDYARVLIGSGIPQANPQQMAEALKHLKPYKAYSIDRYGLYFAVMMNYARCLNRMYDYNEAVKGDTATVETRKRFIGGFWTGAEARAITWLLSVGVMEPADFGGIDPAEVGEFLNTVKSWADLGDYVTYYFVAKYALLATPEELAEITRPPIQSATPIIEFADKAATEAKQRLDDTADKFADMFEAERKADQERAEAEARAARRDWENKVNAAPIPLHEVPNIICSRPVEISPRGKQLIEILPIQQYIDDFTRNEENAQYGLITPFTVQRVVEAINILPHFLKQTNEDGQLLFHTTMNEFAELCGYIDANLEQQRALLGGLMLVSEKYFVVNRPYKVITKEYTNGRKKRITVGGPTATQLVHVKIGIETGGLDIIIDPDAMRGKPTLIQIHDYKALRAAAGKNLSRSRFNAQILSKGHKNVDDMLNEVFGYDEKLKLCEGDAEALKRAKRDIRQHKPRNRAKLFEWFNETQAAGIITYTYNEKTNTVSWKRLDVPGTTDTTEPDEQ